MDLDTLYISMYLDSDHDTLLALKYCPDYYIDNGDNELETIELDDEYGVYPGIYSPRMSLHQAIEARRANIVEALLEERAYTANCVDKYSKFYPLHVLTSIPETEAVIDRIAHSMQNTVTMFKHINITNCKNIISEIESRAKKMYLHKSTSIEIIKEVLHGNTEISDDDLKRMENTVKQNELRISELLFSKDAKIDVIDKNGYTPLRNAVINGNLELTKLFLSRGANIRLSYNGLTIFEISTLSPNVEVIKEIIRVYGCNTYGNVLLNASTRGHASVIKYLLDIGIRFKANNRGETPLHRAASVGSLELIELFLSYGVNVDIKDKIGNTPLFYALHYPYVVKALLEKGANPNIVNIRGITPLLRTINISDLSTQHIISYMLLKYRDNFNSEISTIDANLINNNVSVNEIKISCEKELERMKSIRINDKYSLITFVTTDNVKLLSKLVKNTIIDSIDITFFQVYGPLLKRSINTAIELRNKFDTAMSMLNSVLEDTCWEILPVDIQNEILFMLEESELPVVS
ncbi:CRPV-018 [Crowpox virus]|nr:CRPV-018 [Crowpox virus]